MRDWKNVHLNLVEFNPFTPKLKIKVYSPNIGEIEKSGNEKLDSIIIFHLSKLWKAKFSLLWDVIFLVRLQGKFDNDHSLFLISTWSSEGLPSSNGCCWAEAQTGSSNQTTIWTGYRECGRQWTVHWNGEWWVPWMWQCHSHLLLLILVRDVEVPSTKLWVSKHFSTTSASWHHSCQSLSLVFSC